MDVLVHEWYLIFLIAAAQGFFLSFLLFTSSSFDFKNQVLGTLIILFSISLIDYVWYWSEIYLEYPHFLGISMSFPFFYGPLLFFYFQEVTSAGSSVSRKTVYHFIVPIAMVVYHLPFYISSSSVKLEAIQQWNSNLFNALGIPFLSMVSLVYYSFASYQMMIHYERRFEVSILKASNWLFQVFMVYGLFVTLYVCYFIWILTGTTTRLSDYLVGLGYSFFIYFIGYIGYAKSKLLNGIKIHDTKYQSSTLTGTASQQVFEHVKKHLKETKVYTNSHLRLSGLASQLSLTTHQLSQVINEYSGGNFSEFVNSYRIAEAKKRLDQNTRINLLAIDVGFNNKTSFNLAFKKFVGCSPTEYRKMKLAGVTPEEKIGMLNN